MKNKKYKVKVGEADALITYILEEYVDYKKYKELQEYKYDKEHWEGTWGYERAEEKRKENERREKERKRVAFADAVAEYFKLNDADARIDRVAVKRMCDDEYTVAEVIAFVYRNNGYRTLEEVLKDRRISFDTKLEIGYDLIDRLDNAGNTDI